MAEDIGHGDEVITTPYTFFATAGAIARVGAKPVFVDIDPATYNLDVSQVESKITTRTRAIIPVHLYGQMADMDPIVAIAERHDLIVIEDAAQAIGAEYKGRRAGSIGHIGCFSFFPSKNLGAFGDGGMVTTDNSVFADRIKLYRNHGYKPKYYNKVVGGNFRLDAIQAAVLRIKLKYLDQWTQARQRNAAILRDLAEASGISIASSRPGNSHTGADQQATGIFLPNELPARRHIYNQFVIRCSRRDALMAHPK